MGVEWGGGVNHLFILFFDMLNITGDETQRLLPQPNQLWLLVLLLGCGINLVLFLVMKLTVALSHPAPPGLQERNLSEPTIGFLFQEGNCGLFAGTMRVVSSMVAARSHGLVDILSLAFFSGNIFWGRTRQQFEKLFSKLSRATHSKSKQNIEK